MKKVIYARYSSEKQSEGVSIEYQIEQIRISNRANYSKV